MKQFEAERIRAYNSVVGPIRRAQDVFRLRSDFVLDDSPAVDRQRRRYAATSDAAPNAWRRFPAYILQVFTAPGRLLQGAPSPRAMYPGPNPPVTGH